jgi:hypothetical protein
MNLARWLALTTVPILALVSAYSVRRVHAASESIEYFIATTGDDFHGGSRSTPFATFERARKAVRSAKTVHPNASLTVTVRGGLYELPATLVFTPEDSGTTAAPVVWKAAPGEEVILSGGRRIQQHWTTSDGKIYWADVPEARDGAWNFDQLFVNGHRATKARYPNLLREDPLGKSWLYVGGQKQDRILAGLARRGDFLEYSFETPASHNYDVWLGVSCPGQAIENHLAVIVDGHPISLPPIASTKSFRTVRYTRLARLSLKSGRHRARIENTGDTEFRVHLSRLIFTDAFGLEIPGVRVPDVQPSEHRVDLRPEDDTSHAGKFSSIGFQLFVPEEGSAPDHFTIHADPDRIKSSWASDPEARINLVAGLQYFNEVLKIDSIDAPHGIIRVSGKETQELIRNGNHFFVSGVLSELDTPGEWYLDSRAGRLYYWPLPGEDPTRSTFIAPRLNRIIEVAGDLDGSARVRWLKFVGFTFEYSAGSTGYVALRTPADAAVRFNGAWNCTIDSCRFRNIDGYGIWLNLDSCENAINGNTIEEMGGGGVVLTSARVAYGDLADSRPTVAGYAPLRNRFTRNHIHHGGQVRICSAGFLLDTRPLSTALEPGNLIAFNEVHHMPRQGVFAFRNQGGNVVAYNYFHDLVTDSADAGGINFATMNNVAAPLLIKNNVVRRVTGLLRSSEGRLDYFGGVGIYLDWGTSHARVINNIVDSTRFASLLINGGSFNTIGNNIFLNDDKTAIFISDGEAIGIGHTFMHNIAVNTTPHSMSAWILPTQMRQRLQEPAIPFATSDYNLYWNGGRTVVLPPVGSLETWKSDGFDQHSRLADPLFADTGKTIALEPGSPSIVEGFQPIDARNTGIVATSEESLDVRQLEVANEIVHVPEKMQPGTSTLEAKLMFRKSARYLVYLRYSAKQPNRSLVIDVSGEHGAIRTTLNEHLSLGRVPDPRWGIYIGTYDFAPGRQEGVSLDWKPQAPGNLPAEIVFLEQKPN